MEKHLPDSNSSRHSRRGFLARMGIGVAAAAAASLPFGLFRNNSAEASGNPFPNKGSIFHPVSDPRLDPRRKNTS